ncbi:DUF6301 family protein [Nocardia tengchongensis]|uniref:DUF6301 family protein n=1 Tax=Nocardia tengchongensis TaxID=2055889 RepID=UPI0036ACDAA4
MSETPALIGSGQGDRRWATLGFDEIMELATRLVSLGAAWTSDPRSFAAAVGWPISASAPGVDQLVTGPGTAKGYVYAREDRVFGVELPITMPVPYDDVDRLGYLFTILSPTLEEALGRSTEPRSTSRHEIVWANDDLRLSLVQTTNDIRLLTFRKEDRQ